MRSRLKNCLHCIYCGFLHDKRKWLKIDKIFKYLRNFDIVLDCISVKTKWFIYFWLWLVVKTFMDLKAQCQEIYLTIIFVKDCFPVLKVESEIFVRRALKFNFNRVEFDGYSQDYVDNRSMPVQRLQCNVVSFQNISVDGLNWSCFPWTIASLDKNSKALTELLYCHGMQCLDACVMCETVCIVNAFVFVNEFICSMELMFFV